MDPPFFFLHPKERKLFVQLSYSTDAIWFCQAAKPEHHHHQ